MLQLSKSTAPYIGTKKRDTKEGPNCLARTTSYSNIDPSSRIGVKSVSLGKLNKSNKAMVPNEIAWATVLL
eukprot:3606868-Amphidinium_carterae.1